MQDIENFFTYTCRNLYDIVFSIQLDYSDSVGWCENQLDNNSADVPAVHFMDH